MVESVLNEKGYPVQLEYGKFEYIEELGVGGQGMVCLYKSLPNRNGTPSNYPDLVAVKFDPGKETANLGEALFLKE
jgi:hypothetical protein